METRTERYGKCCAGILCIFVNMQLQNNHKYKYCHQVDHILCAIVDNTDDSHICMLCHQKRDKGQGLPNSDQDTSKQYT